MAKKNRTEALIEVDNALVPTLTLEEHKTLLKDNILNSIVYERDVIASQTPVAGAVTIDYSNKDTATVSTSVNLNVSFNNIENGAVKYLSVTKLATNTVSFSGATDVSPRKAQINTIETLVIYQISHKDGNIYVKAISIDFDFKPDIDNAIATSLDGLITKVINIGDWDMDNTVTLSIAHGLTLANIRQVEVYVRKDSDAGLYPGAVYRLDYYAIINSGYWLTNGTDVLMFRSDTGTFNSADFNQTSYNRGWIIIKHV